VVHIPSVASEMLAGNVGYAELSQFAEDTSTELPRRSTTSRPACAA